MAIALKKEKVFIEKLRGAFERRTEGVAEVSEVSEGRKGKDRGEGRRRGEGRKRRDG